MEVAAEIECIHTVSQALGYVCQHYASNTQKQPGHDLIFLDIKMPEMNGYEFLNKLEELEIDQSRFFIVFLTSSPYKKDRQKAAEFDKKLDGYLVKPLDKETVEGLVDKII